MLQIYIYIFNIKKVNVDICTQLTNMKFYKVDKLYII